MRLFVLSHRYLDPARRGKLEALAALGTEVRVAVPERWLDLEYRQPTASGWERVGGLEIAPVRVEKPGLPTEARWQRGDLQRLVRDFRPDLVHIDEEATAHVAGAAIRVARTLGIPATVSATENLVQRHPWATRSRRRSVLRTANGVVAESGDAARLASREAPTVPTTVLPQAGVTIPHATADVTRWPCTVGFVGRLTLERGLDVLFRALEGVPGHEWRLAIVGDGPERERLEAIARQVHLPARLQWLGTRTSDEMQSVWPSFDLVAVPSRATPTWAEPLGRAALSAMAHGIPVVTTTSGVLPEIVGDTGLIVHEGEPEALRGALADLIGAPDRRASLGAAARTRAIDSYSDQAIARGLLAFWTKVIDQ
jgi:glycosyltransferase involved in cell wall biosynthesis